MCGDSIAECLNCQKPDCNNNYVRKPSGYTDAQRRANAKKSALRKKRAEQGLCTECGKRPPRKGYRMCRQCQVEFARYKEDELRRKGVKPRSLLDGVTLCAKCGKDAPLDGYKLCKRCYETSIANLNKTPTHKGIRRKDDNFRKGVDAFWRSL